jgi:hypothetical protein
MYDELQRITKEAVVVCFKIHCRDSSGGSEKNDEAAVGFLSGTSRIETRTFTA